MIFKQLAMATILFFFQNEAKNVDRQVFITINHEDIFINE